MPVHRDREKCWSCLRSLEDVVDVVEIDADRLPCCLECWDSMTASERLAAVAMIRESRVRTAAFEELRIAMERSNRDSGESWLSGRN